MLVNTSPDVYRYWRLHTHGKQLWGYKTYHIYQKDKQKANGASPTKYQMILAGSHFLMIDTGNNHNLNLTN